MFTGIERLKTLIVISVALTFVLTITGFVITPLPHQSERDADAVRRGKLVFEKIGCFMCHGNEGSGGVRNRNSITGEKVPALTYASRGYTDAGFRLRIKQGSTIYKKLNPSGPIPPVSMPPFNSRITDEELTDLIEYLRSLTPVEDEEPRPVSKERPVVPEYMLAGDSCHICHNLMTRKFQTNLHYGSNLKRKGGEEGSVCVGCHGDGKEHAKKYGEPSELTLFTKGDSTSVQKKNEACLQCHERGNENYWKGSVHEVKSVACVDCHKIMEPASGQMLLTKNSEIEVCFQCHLQQRAQMQRSSHMPFREGKVTCRDCHNAHGTANEKLLTETTVNENCYKCHAEKRGPFLWEHPPVAENCLNCHEPHGSQHDKLLTMERPRLCQQCHTGGEEHLTKPQLATVRYVFNRSCQNCHSEIHGSNSPSGALFHR